MPELLFYLAAFLGSAAIMAAFNRFELRAWRQSAAAHWTERARKLWPARVARNKNVWGLPIVTAQLTALAAPDLSWAVAGLCALVGAIFGNYPMDHETIEDLGFQAWAHLVFGSWLIGATGWLLLIVTAIAMPAELGAQAWATFAIMLVIWLGMHFGLTMKLYRLVRLRQPPSVRLQALVDETATAMGVRVKATWELIAADTNAMAYVMTGELGFSRRLVAIATDDELKAICAHELGHLSESRWVKTVRLLGAFKFVPLVFARPAWHLYRGPGVAVLFFAGLLIWVLAINLSRIMEHRADKIARNTMENPAIYARALEKMHQSSQVPAVLAKGSLRTHPDLYDRMLAAGVTPDYPRPLPPGSDGISGIATYVVIGFLFWQLANKYPFF